MKKNKLLPLIGIVLLFSMLFYLDYEEQNNLKENSIATVGKIVTLKSKFRARYSLIYEYNVDGIKYTGSVGITPFDCDNGNRNCIGSEFTVYYSLVNPENSRIDLEKYEKYKTTVEFIKLD